MNSLRPFGRPRVGFGHSVFEILMGLPTIMSGRQPDICVLGIRKQLGLERQTWGCHDRSWLRHLGRAYSARRPLQGVGHGETHSS